MNAMLFNTYVNRWVVPFGGAFQADDDGLRHNPAWSPDPHAVPVAALVAGTSLALLGEPGAGKTTALHSLAQRVGHAVVHLDEVGTGAELSSVLAARTATMPEAGTLLLDSLDECPVPQRALIRTLTRGLRGRDDLCVLVGCRTADWPRVLADEFAEVLGTFSVYELLPLSAEDVMQLADSRGVDGAAFLAAVRTAAAGPLAAFPLTLDLLLTTHARTGELPPVPRVLFETGLRLLAAEPDGYRARAAVRSGTDTQRLAAACRCAAVLLLCGRTAVTLPDADAVVGDLSVDDLILGRETIDGFDFEVTSELLLDTLGSALFTGRGPGRVGVAHAMIGAFLTARHLSEHAVPPHQLRALLTRTTSTGATSIPSRLRQVAAWLVDADPEQHGWLIDVDPEAFVAYGVLVPDRLKAAVVGHLLQRDESPRGLQLQTLRHPRIVEQLRAALQRPLLEDAGPHFGSPVSRSANTALRLGRVLELRELIPDVAALVSQVTLNSYLRSAAAFTLYDLDPEQAADTLRPVLDEVLSQPDQDPNAELRGMALEACWPERLTAGELLTALSTSWRSNFIGALHMFITHLGERLDDTQAELLVRAASADDGPWTDDDDAGQIGSATGIRRRDGKLMLAILIRGLGAQELANFAKPAGQLLARSTSYYGYPHPTLPPSFADPADLAALDNRRAVVLAALPHMPSISVFRLVHDWRPPDDAEDGAVRSGLVGQDDLTWLFDLDPTGIEDHVRHLLRAVFNPYDQIHQQIAWDSRDHPLLPGSIGWWFDPVTLDGPVAAEMREGHSYQQRRQWDGAAVHVEQLHDAWSRVRGGDATALSGLCHLLRVDPETGQQSYTLDPRFETWPSWTRLAADAADVAPACRAFLLAIDPRKGWSDTPSSITWSAVAGTACLYWLQTQAPELLDLGSDAWAAWAPVLVRLPGLHDPETAPHLLDIIERAAALAPDDLKAALGAEILGSVTAGCLLPDLRAATLILDEEFTQTLFEALRRLLMTTTALEAELCAFDKQSAQEDELRRYRQQREQFFHRCQDIESLGAFLAVRQHDARALLGRAAQGEDEMGGAVRLPAIRCLVAAGVFEADELVDVLYEDESLGRALVAHWPEQRRRQPTLSAMSPAALGRLWTWLQARWAEEADSLVGFGIDDSHAQELLRRSVLEELGLRGTTDATSIVSDLHRQWPENYALRAALSRVEAQERDSMWQGPEPAELRVLIAGADKILIKDEDDLYRNVLEGVGRLQQRLQLIGHLLWNEVGQAGRPMFVPKHEAEISSMLADHLRHDLGKRLVVNREVQVRPTNTTGAGLTVDILNSAHSESGTDVLHCPIEIKGSWNARLFEDLQEQLVDDYMAVLQTRRGVYVCAWFGLELWTGPGGSRSVAARRSRAQVQDDLLDRATRASADGRQVGVVVLDVPRPAPSARADSRGVATHHGAEASAHGE